MGAAWGRGATQAGGAVSQGEAWARVWVEALPWRPPIEQLCMLEHWQQLIMHRALHICWIALQLCMGCNWQRTYNLACQCAGP